VTHSGSFRLYEPDECGADGYPFAWHDLGDGRGVKHLVREQAGHRCVRCLHPYECGVSGGEWSPCDEQCRHDTTRNQRWKNRMGEWVTAPINIDADCEFEARWRILTVHHLRLGHDAKRDLRWWNLAALCQRCHLQIQGKVQLERVWPHEHSEWFKPYAAGWYAASYLGEDLTREQVEARLDELLALELIA
jgi:hypothetical protein